METAFEQFSVTQPEHRLRSMSDEMLDAEINYHASAIDRIRPELNTTQWAARRQILNYDLAAHRSLLDEALDERDRRITP
jgi:hypothetical protein